MPESVELRIRLEKRVLPIPYGPAKREDGENYGYRSLVDNLDALDEIPELLGESGIKRFIGMLNEPGGEYESVRVVHWFDGDGTTRRRCVVIGFILRDRRAFAEYSNCFMVAGNLMAAFLEMPDRDVCLLEIQPAQLILEGIGGWIMDLYVSGCGESEDEARQNLDRALEELMPVFQPRHL